MTPIERETFLLHAETEEHHTRIAQAQENIAETFRTFRKPYVAYSGGKDSLVMLHLALQQMPDIMVYHWDYGPYYMPREIEREVINIAISVGVKAVRCETTPKYVQLKRTAVGVLGKVLYGRVIPQLKSEGYDCSLIGLRAAESRKRTRRTKSLFEKDGSIHSAFPIRHLSARDVWAYIVSHDLPYCSHYDRYGPLLGWENVRFCTYFDPEFDKLACSTVDGVLVPEFRNPIEG